VLVEVGPEVVEVVGPLGFGEAPEVGQTIGASWFATGWRWPAYATITVEGRAGDVLHGGSSDDALGRGVSVQNRSAGLKGGVVFLLRVWVNGGSSDGALGRDSGKCASTECQAQGATGANLKHLSHGNGEGLFVLDRACLIDDAPTGHA
jgi:hypothetical protein